MTTPATAPTNRSAGAVSEFFAGFGTLVRGFATWRRRPRLMALGLVPALIVAAVLGTVLVVVLVNIASIATFVTPFADTWPATNQRLIRVVAGLAILVGIIVLIVFGFTGLTLLVGDPFYEKIWRGVETDLGGISEMVEPGFWRAVRDSIGLAGRALLTAIALALVGLIPGVGTILAATFGLFVAGRLLALELTTRPLEARGLGADERRRLLRTRSPRVLGFGVAVHLCFLIPGGAVAVMPAAVAGATLLARHVLEADSGVALQASSTQAAPRREPPIHAPSGRPNSL